ncbi:tRNA dimethylallyltransferase-like [Lytechinus variegatus]|uniref:tRNA dimethylallyltransferase-like n=1 Tax=Lytechinus variegatus TaxID=7654 RepID=UPI001BB11FD3|nr:tRNA dimethylallyltransferase-like [Lytechinus variegatus]
MQAFRCPVVVVLGATGAGKSRLALELGRRFNGEIISADSMQVYKGLDIITNKVTPEEQEQCPHHALGIVHPLQRFTVVDFRNRVIPLIDGLVSRGRLPIIVGGTNYYIEALLWKVLLTNEDNGSSEGLMFETRGDVEKLRLRRRVIQGKRSHGNSEGTHLQERTLSPSLRTTQEPRRKQEEQCDLQVTIPPGNDSFVTNNQSEHTDHHTCEGSDQSGLEKSSDVDQSKTRTKVGCDHVEPRSNQVNMRTDHSHVVLPMMHDNSFEVGQSENLKVLIQKGCVIGGGTEDEDFDLDVTKMDSSELHELLQDIDPLMADRLHPNDRRKIIRSLQVYEQHGVCHSDLLKEQRNQEGGSHLGGPLRYKDPCVFWVQTEQTVLDTRLDKRVDSMMNAGLVRELEDFHKEYNEQRLAGQIREEEMYTQGIFQSIGFKEFHPYLVIDEDRKQRDEGQRLLEESIERLKTATRQYARRQLKWIRNRFLKRGENSPAVFGLDSTKPEEWDRNVLEPATRILEAVMQGKESPISPLPCEERKVNDLSQTFVCDVCKGRQFVGLQQWTAHLQSRRHQKQARKKRLRELMDKEGSKKGASLSSSVSSS